MDLSVIIVNYNVKYFLEQCLCSVLKACENIHAEIFVIDNNSTDGSRAYLEKKFPGVSFTWQNSNPGFGKSNNRMLEYANGKFILFLNPDTIVPGDCFEKCISFFNTHESCGALGVKMIDGGGRFLKECKRSFPDPMTSFFKMAGLAALFPASRLFARYYAGHLPADQDNEIDVVAGAFMMVSKQALGIVKGFDEDFFMYGEDIDISYRIRQAGLKNYYFAGTTIIHFKGESTQRLSNSYIRHFYGAMHLFVVKHFQKEKAAYYAMLAAIGLSRLLALSAIPFKKWFNSGGDRKKGLNTAVIAGQQVFDEMLRLLKYSTGSEIIIGRIAIDPGDKGIFIGRLNDIKEVIRKQSLVQLVFCEGELDFKTIIEITNRLEGEVDFLFHAGKSMSIVGSSHKNENGIFIASS